MNKKLSLFNFGASLLVSSNLFAHAGDPHFHAIDFLAFCSIIFGLISIALITKKLSIFKVEINK